MKKLFLMVNGVCDIACDYCYYSTKYETRDRARIEPSNARAVVEKIKSVGFTVVILTGGDPLHSHLKNETYTLIEELKKQDLRVIVNTSGAGLDDDDIDKILRLNIDRVDFSVDSHSEVIHNSARGKYAETVNAIEKLLAAGYDSIATVTVINSKNASTILQTLKWFKDIGIQDSHIHLAFEPAYKLDEKLEAIEYMRSATPYLGYKHASQHIDLTLSAFSGNSPHPMAQCRMGKDYFVCSPEGKLTPCFHRKDISLGNLFTDQPEEIIRVMEHNQLTDTKVPSCFGPHCASLFDNPMFWDRELVHYE